MFPRVCLAVHRGGLALALAAGLLPIPAFAQSAPGDSGIYPKPAAPTLPPAGGTFIDPTFLTTIVRVTDPSTAPDGAAVNSAATDSMFNADGTRFYLHHQKAGTHLYAVDPATAQVRHLGQLPRTPSGSSLAYDGAPWDPVDPQVLYAIVPSTTRRELWQITLPLPGTLTLLHDFSAEVPTGGYPSSRVQVSPDGRSFAITASTTGGQDTYDYVVVWDRETGKTWVLHTPTRLGTLLHGIFMDGSGEYLSLHPAGSSATRYIWHWPTDTVEALSTGSPDYFKGHISPGTGEVLNPGPAAGSWLYRALATPHTFTELLRYPRKGVDLSDWFEDSHTSRLLPGGSFFTTRYVGSFAWGAFTLHAGAVYKLVGYLSLSTGFDVPEEVRYKGLPLEKTLGIPTAPNQWAYEAITDTLFVWLPDGLDPQLNRAAISIFDWRPLMEEIVQVFKDASGAWTWRRLAHHRAQYTGAFSSSPRGNASPTGAAVLFQSNWDGSARNDAFLLVVPSLSGTGGTSGGTAQDTTPPSVSFTSPGAGSTVSGVVTVAVSASDNVGVNKIEYRLDGALAAAYSPPVASFSWDSTEVANGTHTWAATAYDAAGNTGQASVSFTVQNQLLSLGDTTPPTASITSPANGATVTGTVKINVTASDNLGLSQVNVYADNALVGSLGCSGTSCGGTVNWLTSKLSKGEHSLVAEAIDAAGNHGWSAVVKVLKK